MNCFKVGTNFDFGMLHIYDELNAKQNNAITEIYGSDKAHANLSARPDFRLPEIDMIYLSDYIYNLKKIGIGFNYTINSIFPCGNKQEFVRQADEIKYFVEELQKIGVNRITIANPILLELLKDIDIKIEISTIAHIDALTQIKYLKTKYPQIDKICGSLLKNRDFKFLKKAANYCQQVGIIYEIMVNEFCGVGGNGFATHCVYRDSCYICHSTNKTLEDANSFNEYPMKECCFGRNESPSNWLKLHWVRPEDIKVYNDIGINHFKITGRTGSSKYMEKTIKRYLTESFDGNLLELWKPLESIKGEPEFKHSYFIQNKKLDGFINHFVEGAECHNEICGETCDHCDRFYKERML